MTSGNDRDRRMNGTRPYLHKRNKVVSKARFPRDRKRTNNYNVHGRPFRRNSKEMSTGRILGRSGMGNCTTLKDRTRGIPRRIIISQRNHHAPSTTKGRRGNSSNTNTSPSSFFPHSRFPRSRHHRGRNRCQYGNNSSNHVHQKDRPCTRHRNRLIRSSSRRKNMGRERPVLPLCKFP